MTVTSLMVKGKTSKFSVLTVYSNLEMRSCLDACVSLRHETTEKLLSSSLLRDEQRLSLGELVDGP